MTTTSAVLADGEIRLERDMIEIPPMMGPVLDENWRHTDKAGHQHAARGLGATLTEVREDCFCELVNEPHDVHVRWECSECGETVEPGTRYQIGPSYIPGAIRMVVIHRVGSGGQRAEVTYVVPHSEFPDLAERIIEAGAVAPFVDEIANYEVSRTSARL